MRWLIALLALLIAPALAQSVSGVRMNFPVAPNGPGGITAIFLNTTINAPEPGVWLPVDVTTLGLPSDTTAIDLGGFLIITNGENIGISDLTIAYRPYGNRAVTCGNYISQAISVNPPHDNGAREQANTWVALNAGKFEYCWQRGIVDSTWPNGTLQPWPIDPAFAINLNIEAWITP